MLHARPIIRGTAAHGFDGAIKELEKLAGQPVSAGSSGTTLSSRPESAYHALADRLERAVGGGGMRKVAAATNPLALAERLVAHAGGMQRGRRSLEKTAMLLVAAEAQEEALRRGRGQG